MATLQLYVMLLLKITYICIDNPTWSPQLAVSLSGLFRFIPLAICTSELDVGMPEGVEQHLLVELHVQRLDEGDVVALVAAGSEPAAPVHHHLAPS